MITKFVAGTFPTKMFLGHIRKGKPSFILLSYYYIKEAYDEAMMMISEYRKMGVGVMLDSGAFQAYKKGVGISVDDYASFVVAHEGMFDIVVNLDDMNSWEQSLSNLNRMAELGVSAMPVYHQGEPIKEFDAMCETFKLVGIGKIAYANDSVRRRVLDTLFGRHPDNDFHGFGVTTIDLIKDYPFYSVDSASWALWAAYGLLLTDIGAIRCTPRTTKLSDTHIVELSDTSLNKIAAQAKRYGLSFRKLTEEDGTANAERMTFNCIAFTEQIERDYNRVVYKRRSVM